MRSIWAGSSTVRPQESVNMTVSAVFSSEGWALGVWETEGSGEPEADGLEAGVLWVQAARETAAREEGFVPELLDDMEPYMVTDMDKGAYMDMALAFLEGGASFGEEEMITLPGTPAETSIYDEYHADEEQILPIVLDLFYREAQ